MGTIYYCIFALFSCYISLFLICPPHLRLILGRMFEFPVGISFSLAYYSPASIFAFIFPCMHAFISVYPSPRQPPDFDYQSLPGQACNRRSQYCTQRRPPGDSHAFPIFKSSVLFYLFVSLHVCGRSAGELTVAHLKHSNVVLLSGHT